MTEHNIAVVAPIVVVLLLAIIGYLSLRLGRERRRADFYLRVITGAPERRKARRA